MDFDDLRWWSKDAKGKRHERLFNAMKACEADDDFRRKCILDRIRMYGNRAYAGLSVGDYSRLRRRGRSRLNIVQDVCDTAINHLITERPKPLPIPIMGSNHTIRRKARLLDRFLQGQFRVSRVRPKMIQLLADAIIVGDGLVKVGEDGRQITVERAFSGDLSVPALEARGGEPRTLYQTHYVDREVLKQIYARDEDGKPDSRLEELIDGLDRASGDGWWASHEGRLADRVKVVEGWRLPSVTGGDDGKHIVAVAAGELRLRPWKHDYFPFVRLGYTRPYFGYWHDSMVDVVEGQQVEINRCVAKEAMGNDISGHAIIWVPKGQENKFNWRKMSNRPLSAVPYMGERPHVDMIEAVSPRVEASIERYKREARELAGVFQLGGDEIPAGLETGEAVKTFARMGSRRFRRFSEGFQAAHIDLAEQMIDRGRDLFERNGEFAVPAARDRHSMARVPWKDIDMEADQYVLTVFPTSSLPDDPAGRIAAVETLVRIGAVPPNLASALLDFPDLEGMLFAKDRAAFEHTSRHIEIMLDEGRRMQPIPYGDLELTMHLASAHLLIAEVNETPEDRTQLVRDYLSGVHTLLAARQRAQMELAQAAGAQTGGVRSGEAGAPPAQGTSGVAPTAVAAAPAEVTA